MRKKWQGQLDDETEELATKVIGAAIEVHRVLGPGYAEQVYEAALIKELTLRRIAWEQQKTVRISYQGDVVETGRIDLSVDAKIIIELKAVETLLPVHAAQLHSYLKITGYPLGLLMNFNVARLKEGLQRVLLKENK
ncbi:GxxExxY protein [Azotosporobacter soli]|uniref:GxxExxY protein n=1 Tax=Azotosporobacter soli TaxID=3055040 RepID=UPI0031FF221F